MDIYFLTLMMKYNSKHCQFQGKIIVKFAKQRLSGNPKDDGIDYEKSRWSPLGLM